MPESARIDDLRRRVDKDPASLAFAPLAEEYRRAGQLDDAVRVCRAGLARHPEYLSARVTLGRALQALGQIEPAYDELSAVLRAAPENLAALRGVADICVRRGELGEALRLYRRACALAPHDPEIAAAVRHCEAALPPQQTHDDPLHGWPQEEVHDRAAHDRGRAREIAALDRWLNALESEKARLTGTDPQQS